VQAKDVSDLHAELGREKLLPTIQASVVEIQTPDRQKSENKRPPLTIRTIDEILAMQFDPADLILPNGYLVLGECTAMCGIAASANRA